MILLITCLTLLAKISSGERTAHPITNPHHHDGSQCSCPAQIINPKQIIANRMLTQQDTFLSLETAKIAKVPVPLYNFKQPARLNPGQLPFKILLVHEVGPGAVALRVEDEQAQDSWFVGYQWDVLVCECEDNKVTHIGWKFNSKEDPALHFYALIVRTNEDNQRTSTSSSSIAQALREYLTVGQPATSLILGMLAVQTSTSNNIGL